MTANSAQNQTTQEAHTFEADENIVAHLIFNQGNNVAKALCELVMNSVDAGARTVWLDIHSAGFECRDDGNGFKDRADILTNFKRFGTPHVAGDATHGRFRLGRGQIMSFSKVTWRSGSYAMSVDVRRTQNMSFVLAEGEAPVSGCLVAGEWYAPHARQNNAEMGRNRHSLFISEDNRGETGRLPNYLLLGILSEVEHMLKFIDCNLILNGREIGMPSIKKAIASGRLAPWSKETDTAYYQKEDTSGYLLLYSQGVLVGTFTGRSPVLVGTYGFGGTITTKLPLRLNTSRTEIMLETCEVWQSVLEDLAQMQMREGEKTAWTKARLQLAAQSIAFRDPEWIMNACTAPIISLLGGKKLTLLELLFKAESRKKRDGQYSYPFIGVLDNAGDIPAAESIAASASNIAFLDIPTGKRLMEWVHLDHTARREDGVLIELQTIRQEMLDADILLHDPKSWMGHAALYAPRQASAGEDGILLREAVQALAKHRLYNLAPDAMDDGPARASALPILLPMAEVRRQYKPSLTLTTPAKSLSKAAQRAWAGATPFLKKHAAACLAHLNKTDSADRAIPSLKIVLGQCPPNTDAWTDTQSYIAISTKHAETLARRPDHMPFLLQLVEHEVVHCFQDEGNLSGTLVEHDRDFYHTFHELTLEMARSRQTLARNYLTRMLATFSKRKPGFGLTPISKETDLLIRLHLTRIAAGEILPPEAEEEEDDDFVSRLLAISPPTAPDVSPADMERLLGDLSAGIGVSETLRRETIKGAILEKASELFAQNTLDAGMREYCGNIGFQRHVLKGFYSRFLTLGYSGASADPTSPHFAAKVCQEFCETLIIRIADDAYNNRGRDDKDQRSLDPILAQINMGAIRDGITVSEDKTLTEDLNRNFTGQLIKGLSVALGLPQSRIGDLIGKLAAAGKWAEKGCGVLSASPAVMMAVSKWSFPFLHTPRRPEGCLPYKYHNHMMFSQDVDRSQGLAPWLKYRQAYQSVIHDCFAVRKSYMSAFVNARVLNLLLASMLKGQDSRAPYPTLEEIDRQAHRLANCVDYREVVRAIYAPESAENGLNSLPDDEDDKYALL